MASLVKGLMQLFTGFFFSPVGMHIWLPCFVRKRLRWLPRMSVYKLQSRCARKREERAIPGEPARATFVCYRRAIRVDSVFAWEDVFFM